MGRLFWRLIQAPRIFFYKCISSCRVIGRPTLYQPLLTPGKGVVEFSGKVSIGVFPSPYFLVTYAHIEARHSSATVKIDGGTWINNNFCAIAEYSEIHIGRRVLIGSNVEIYDSDFHGIKLVDRRRSNPAHAKPVRIGDDVFVGSNVRILKGVNVGEGAVVANSAVVIRDVDPYTIVGGNPARVIGYVPK